MSWTFTPSADVQSALDAGQPIVALESTIITHGMPYPANLETAVMVEQTLRNLGAVPATIAVINGTLHVGLTAAQMDGLAKATGVMKLSRADLGFAMAQGRTGSTTVAATMMAAHLAGITTFATGGIGGVHRGAETSFDVSADLAEFGLSPVTVVCAGAKAILDIPKTLEVLETNGVPVIAFGQDEVAAFWSRSSGLAAPLRLDHAADIAKVAHMRATQPNPGGVLVANPIPEAAEIPKDQIDPVIEAALTRAAQEGITGKAVTPYLLAQVLEATRGASLTANMALIENNAALAAQIAIARAKC